MTGYNRQSTIVDGDSALASLWNDEYDQLQAAFNRNTGHKHDGTTTEGPVIALIGDAGLATPLNKVVVNTTDDRVSVYNDVAGASVEQVRFEDGVIKPVTDSDIDLGTNAVRFKNAYIDSIICPTLASTFISAVEASDVASVTFTSGIDSTYDEYILVASNVRGSHLTPTYLNLYTSADGGSSWQTDLITVTTGIALSLSGVHMVTGGNPILFPWADRGDGSYFSSYSGVINIFKPADTSTYTHIFHTGHGVGNAGNYPIILSGSGYRQVNEAVNAIKISFTNGNIYKGSFRLYGLRKS